MTKQQSESRRIFTLVSFLLGCENDIKPGRVIMKAHRFLLHWTMCKVQNAEAHQI